jgi:hypothetical protein
MRLYIRLGQKGEKSHQMFICEHLSPGRKKREEKREGRGGEERRGGEEGRKKNLQCMKTSFIF